MPLPVIPVDLAAWCDANDARAQDELFAFLRIPSVSAKSEHKADCLAAAEFVANALIDIGFDATLVETPGHPIVLARVAQGGPCRTDAADLWPLRRAAGRATRALDLAGLRTHGARRTLYARGSVDDKGQLYLHLKALEAHLAVRGTLPGERDRDRRGRGRSGQRESRAVSRARTANAWPAMRS